jgi:hypothetical protein
MTLDPVLNSVNKNESSEIMFRWLPALAIGIVQSPGDFISQLSVTSMILDNVPRKRTAHIVLQ